MVETLAPRCGLWPCVDSLILSELLPRCAAMGRRRYKAPTVKFVTPCFHPNVDQFGNICLDILKVSTPGGALVALCLRRAQGECV